MFQNGLIQSDRAGFTRIGWDFPARGRRLLDRHLRPGPALRVARGKDGGAGQAGEFASMGHRLRRDRGFGGGFLFIFGAS